MSDLSPATVEIKLDGEPVVLACTLDAAIAISSHFGGFGIAHERAQSLDIDASAVIVRYGAGIDAKAALDLRAKIFRAGLINIMPHLTSYILLLMQGGREIKVDAGSGEAKPADSAGS